MATLALEASILITFSDKTTRTRRVTVQANTPLDSPEMFRLENLLREQMRQEYSDPGLDIALIGVATQADLNQSSLS